MNSTCAIFKSRDLSLHVRIRLPTCYVWYVYVYSTLLYGVETKRNNFEKCLYRRILRISWIDKNYRYRGICVERERRKNWLRRLNATPVLGTYYARNVTVSPAYPTGKHRRQKVAVSRPLSVLSDSNFIDMSAKCTYFSTRFYRSAATCNGPKAFFSLPAISFPPVRVLRFPFTVCSEVCRCCEIIVRKYTYE